MTKNLSNQEKIKFDHQKRIFQYFADGGSYSCTDLAKMMNLSNTAVANILDIFLKKKIISLRETSMQNEMGRPSIMYELNPSYGIVASMDLTDEDLIICISNCRMQIISRKIIPNVSFISQGTLTDIAVYLQDFLTQNHYPTFNAICIGTPGKIDFATGYFNYAPKFLDYKLVNLQKFFEGFFHCLVVIKNDVKLALSGEQHFGNCRNKDNVVFLHIDYHYGGAIKLGGKILEGSRGYAAEFGSMRVQNRDENFRYISYDISIGGMIYNYENACRDQNLPIITPTFEQFLLMCQQGDAIALKILNSAAEHTAIEINNLCCILDCTFVVINGRIRFFGNDYLKSIQAYLNKYIYDSSVINIIYTGLDGRATILGGLRCAIEQYTYSLLNIL